MKLLLVLLLHCLPLLGPAAAEVGPGQRRLLPRREFPPLPAGCQMDSCLVVLRGCDSKGNPGLERHLSDCSSYLRPSTTRTATASTSTVTSTTVIFMPSPGGQRIRDLAPTGGIRRRSESAPPVPTSSSAAFKIPAYATNGCPDQLEYSSACSCLIAGAPIITTSAATTTTTSAAAAPTVTVTTTLYAGCTQPSGCFGEHTWIFDNNEYVCVYGVEAGTSLCYEQFDAGAPNVVYQDCSSHEECQLEHGDDWGCVAQAASCTGSYCVKVQPAVCDNAAFQVA